MVCGKCRRMIEVGELYVEAKRRGEHDVYRETADGHPIESAGVPVHVDCPIDVVSPIE